MDLNQFINNGQSEDEIKFGWDSVGAGIVLIGLLALSVWIG